MPDEIIPGGSPAQVGNAAARTQKGHVGQEYRFSYGNTKVRVIVPPAANSSAKAARPIAAAWKSDFDAAASSRPRRKVMNLALVEKDDSTNVKYVTAFDPPIELRVTITDGDTQQKDKASLSLVYCLKGGQWTLFDGVSLSGQGDELVVAISTWYDDPAIGVS